MALLAYDGAEVAAFAATRHLRDDDLETWRTAIRRHFEPRPGIRLLDLGCGTGSWARAFRTWWPGIEVLAVEPSAAMRERAVFDPVVPGRCDDIPFAEASLDGIWLSTVIHHVPDLAAAAREIRRRRPPAAGSPDRDRPGRRRPRPAGAAMTPSRVAVITGAGPALERRAGQQVCAIAVRRFWPLSRTAITAVRTAARPAALGSACAERSSAPSRSTAALS